MIVRHFLQWVRTAEAAERAEATSALARAYLYSELSPDDRAAAEGAMILLLDDPSPLVRYALADALGSSADAPAAVVHALVNDQPDIAIVVLERSPLLLDSDLVDSVAVGGAQTQSAIARRAALPRSVSAAIAEVGSAEACLTLIENAGADLASFSLDRIVARFGHLAAIRESLLAWPDLPAAIRHTLVVKLSETLAGFVVARRWMEEGRAQRIAQEACEKATVILAADVGRHAGVAADRPFARDRPAHRRPGAALAPVRQHRFLRAVACRTGRAAGRARQRAAARPPRRRASRRSIERAGLPASVYPAFRAAIEAMHDDGLAATGRQCAACAAAWWSAC